jgi:DNA invertase Pin-like site-specific DNA recombinase
MKTESNGRTKPAAGPQDAHTMPRRAYSYRRISTNGKQARGGGLARQGDDWGAALCESRGWCLEQDPLIDSGRSGYHQKNLDPKAALGRFLASIESRLVRPGSILLVENLDRLSRADIDDAYDLFRRIIKAGITIVTREPFREYSAESTRGNMLALLEPLFIFARANEESSTKAFRTSSAWIKARENAQDGRPHQCIPPCWLKKTKHGYEKIPERVALIQHLFQLITTEGLLAIVHRMQADGERNLGRTQNWSVRTLQTILRGRAVLGEFQPKQWIDGKRVNAGAKIQDYYPAIISEEEWRNAQAAMNRRRTKGGRPRVGAESLFTGLMIDEATGRTLHMHSMTSAAGDRYSYLIITATRGTRVPYAAAEAAILDTLRMLKTADVLPPELKQSEKEKAVADLHKRVTDLDQRLQQLQKSAADLGEDADAILPVLAQVGRDHKAAAAELERLQLESVTSRGESLSQTQALIEYRDQTNGDERENLDRRIKAMLPSVVREIRVSITRISQRRQLTNLRMLLHSGTVREVTFGHTRRRRRRKVEDHAIEPCQPDHLIEQ